MQRYHMPTLGDKAIENSSITRLYVALARKERAEALNLGFQVMQAEVLIEQAGEDVCRAVIKHCAGIDTE